MDKSAVYRIKVQGVVPESWTDRLGGMGIVSVSSAATTLEGWLPDQAALKGVLNTLYQLHLPLLEITSSTRSRHAQKSIPPGAGESGVPQNEGASGKRRCARARKK